MASDGSSIPPGPPRGNWITMLRYRARLVCPVCPVFRSAACERRQHFYHRTIVEYESFPRGTANGSRVYQE